jgi:histidine ammonia-lyase
VRCDAGIWPSNHASTAWLEPASGLIENESVRRAALACSDLRELVRAAITVAALSHLGVRASTEPYAEQMHAARPHPGQQAVAAALRGLVSEPAGPASRIQDPYGYRALPQVHGPVVDAASHAEQIVTYRMVLACELGAAVRALRLRGIRPAGRSLADAFELAAGALPADTSDRPLDGDVVTAQRLLPGLAALVPPAHPAIAGDSQS